MWFNNKGYVYMLFDGIHIQEHRINALINNSLKETFSLSNDVHHIDHCRFNNDPNNLVLMEKGEHSTFHHKDTKRTIDSKIKTSKTKNTTGYFRVYKMKRKAFAQGFTWCYDYMEGGKHKAITSVDLQKLEQKVKSKGLEWIKLES